MEPPFRPRTPMTKLPPRPYTVANMQAAGMGNMMGMDKQYQLNYKPPPSMPQGQILRHQLQVRLVSLVLLIKTPDQKLTVSLYFVWLFHLRLEQRINAIDYVYCIN